MKRILVSILSMSLLVALLSLSTSALATEPQGASAAVSKGPLLLRKDISPAEQRAALSFWSHAALSKAQPLDMVDHSSATGVDSAALSTQQATGAPGASPAGLAAPDAVAAAQAAYPSDWAAMRAAGVTDADVLGAISSDDIAPAGTGQIFTSYFANKASALHIIYPHIWVGRLSFRTPGGTSYCSASSISGNVMLTAAHCIYDSTANSFYSNWVFTPAYRNGAAPYGTFPATTCWVLTAWVNLSGNYAINSWAQYDVGVCKMGNNSAGRSLNSSVGWIGRQWNWGYVRHFHDLGYPFRNTSDQLIPDAGQYLHACVAESFQQTTDTRGMGCDMSRGKSGGPLVTNYAPFVVQGNVDGVYSGFFIGTANLYAARFTSNNIVLLCNAAGC